MSSRKVFFRIVVMEPETRYKMVTKAAMWAIAPTYLFYRINYMFAIMVTAAVAAVAITCDTLFGGDGK